MSQDKKNRLLKYPLHSKCRAPPDLPSSWWRTLACCIWECIQFPQIWFYHPVRKKSAVQFVVKQGSADPLLILTSNISRNFMYFSSEHWSSPRWLVFVHGGWHPSSRSKWSKIHWVTGVSVNIVNQKFTVFILESWHKLGVSEHRWPSLSRPSISTNDMS